MLVIIYLLQIQQQLSYRLCCAFLILRKSVKLLGMARLPGRRFRHPWCRLQPLLQLKYGHRSWTKSERSSAMQAHSPRCVHTASSCIHIHSWDTELFASAGVIWIAFPNLRSFCLTGSNTFWKASVQINKSCASTFTKTNSGEPNSYALLIGLFEKCRWFTPAYQEVPSHSPSVQLSTATLQV